MVSQRLGCHDPDARRHDTREGGTGELLGFGVVLLVASYGCWYWACMEPVLPYGTHGANFAGACNPSTGRGGDDSYVATVLMLWPNG
jgi:hypothetical protein